MKKVLFTLFFPLLFNSCIKESSTECPYQYNIQLFVQDKNYSNSSSAGIEPVDENLPFKEYVSNIYYTLQNLNIGEDAVDPVVNIITGNEKEAELILDRIPDGEYLLTVWGNVENTATPVKAPNVLHNEKSENTDLYLVSETITIRTGTAQTKSLGLERTKGKLVVTFNNLPDNITRVDEIVTSVYQAVDSRSFYSQKTDVEKIFLKDTQPLTRISTFLAPTVDSETSTVTLSLYTSDSSEPELIISPVEIGINRNEITAVSVNYDSAQGQLEVWVYIDGEWVLVRELDISEI